MYLTVFAASSPVFLFCSFWVYRYTEIDITTMDDELDEVGEESPSWIRQINEAEEY